MYLKPIREFPQYYITKDGKVWSTKTKKWLKPSLDGYGYLQVKLCKDGKMYNRKVHRLVLETFVGSCPGGMQTCHNNGIRTDNRLENLRWDTRSNNAYDAVKHGTCNLLGNKIKRANGEKQHCAKLTEQDVRMIVYIYRTGEFSQREIAKIFKVTQPTIGKIVTGQNWKHIWKGEDCVDEKIPSRGSCRKTF